MANFCVRLKPSVQLTVILSAAHFFVTCMVWLLTLPISVKLLGSAVLIVSLVYYLRHYALLKTKNSIIAFELSEQLKCILKTREGEHIPCIIDGSTFVAPYLVVLNLKRQHYLFLYGVVILSDSIDAEEFRQLRVLLRWKWKKINDRI